MKWLLRIFGVLLSVYVLSMLILPGIVDKKMNKVGIAGSYEVSAQAEEVFKSLEFIADLHCDALLWKRDLNKDNAYGHVDIPKLIEGRVALQAFTIVSKVPYGINFNKNSAQSDMLRLHSFVSGRSPLTWWSVKHRVLAQCSELKKFAKKSEGKFRILYSSEDLKTYLHDRSSNSLITAGFLGIEGMQGLEGRVENVEVLYEAGVRMMSPTHFQDNELGGCAHGETGGGLSDFGKEVLKKIESKNIILDVSHSSPAMLDDIIEWYKKPIITSHTGVKGTCDSPRNLSDKHLKAIAASGGLIGIALFEGAVCSQDVKATAQAMKYAMDLVGVEHVALGSDFDGAIQAPINITGLKLLVQELLQIGCTEKEISLIMGENVKNFWLKNL